MIKVSILIPIGNQEKLIVRCLDSLPKRDDIEVIVIDDCSTDNSYSIIKNNYPYVRLFKNKVKTTIGLTRNKLISYANGKYIFFLDSDDYVYTDAFNTVLNQIDNFDVSEVMHENNKGTIWRSRVYRGAFIKTSLAKTVLFKDMGCYEDTEGKKDFNKKYPLSKKKLFKEVVYHYNEPREGSLSGINRHNK